MLKNYLIIFFLTSACFSQVIVGPGFVDTYAHAQQTATATPNEVIKQTAIVQSDTISVGNVNTSLTIDFEGNSIYTTGTTSLINVNSSLVGPLTIQNGAVSFGGNTAGNNWFYWSGLGTGSNIYLKNLTFDSGVSFNAAYFQEISAGLNFSSVNQFVLDSCRFLNSPNISLLNFSNAGSSSSANDSVFYKNCLFNNSTNAAIAPYFSTSSILNKIQNCTFSNNVSAIFTNGPQTFIGTNNLFISNSTDLGGGMSGVSQTNSGSTNGTSGWGVSCIGNISASTELCDKKNLFLSSASTTRNKGVSINGITGTIVGLDGILHGNACSAGNDDMGCNPYSPALCPGIGDGR